MALCVVHPWAPFLAGLLTGCWIGGIVACVGLLLLVGRRIRRTRVSQPAPPPETARAQPPAEHRNLRSPSHPHDADPKKQPRVRAASGASRAHELTSAVSSLE